MILPFLTTETIVVPAGRTPTVDAPGDKFHCLEASGNFKMCVDGGNIFEWQVGLGFDWRAKVGNGFRKLTFINDTAVDLTITYAVSTVVVIDSRFNVNLQRDLAVQTQAASTRLVAGPTSIDAGATLTRAGSIAGKSRKQIVICVDDPTATLQLKTGELTNPICQTLYPQLPWTIETDDDVLIYNPNGGAVAVGILEIFYR